MLDFRRRSRSTNYLQGRQQYKLLGLMVTAGLVMFLVSMAAEPKRWEWVMLGKRAPEKHEKAPFDPDTRLAARTVEGAEPGTFVAPPEGIPAEAAAKPDSFFPGVRTDYLQTVRDDTVFRKIEGDAWFHLFELLRKTDDAELAKASTGKVSFRQLYQQPREYRGRIVTLKGTVHRVLEKQAPKNSYGIEKYYELVLEPDGEKDQLVIVYSLEVPKDFLTKNSLSERATIHGFSFKRFAYPAKDDVRTAPSVLARNLDWQPAPPPLKAEPEIAPGTVVLIAFGLFVVAAAGYWATRSWRTSPRSGELTTARFTPEVISAIAESDAGNRATLPRDNS